MDRRIHFISGLPRSESTLLSALLQQNPRFHAGTSGSVADMFTTLLHELSGQNELSAFINDAQPQRILRGRFANYYDGKVGNLMLLQHDPLVNEPARALTAVYDFVGEPHYAHDFQHASFDDKGFDQRAGTSGLHHVRARRHHAAKHFAA